MTTGFVIHFDCKHTKDNGKEVVSNSLFEYLLFILYKKMSSSALCSGIVRKRLVDKSHYTKSTFSMKFYTSFLNLNMCRVSSTSLIIPIHLQVNIYFIVRFQIHFGDYSNRFN